MKIYLFFFLFSICNAYAFESLNKILSEESPFQLPKLNYSYSDLNPVIDSETMQIHHSKHHQTYIDKINLAVGNEKLSLKKILNEASLKNQDYLNHGGGHFNHRFFWTLLTPKKVEIPKKLQEKIIKNFSSLENFRAELEKSALSLFGSGWVWVILDSKNELKITTTPNQVSPLMQEAAVKGRPILGIDVWEHAYYLKYQNKRADYLKSIWNIIDWNQVLAYLEE